MIRLLAALAPAAAQAQAPAFLLKDVHTGASSGSPVSLFASAGTTYFGGSTDQTSVELWKTDGTPAGTVLVEDIWPGTGSSYPALLGYSFVDVNGTIIFAAADATGGSELWKTDGTAAGTVRVKDIWPGTAPSEPRHMVGVGGTLFFSAVNDPTGVRHLWKSDGTEAGTVLVKTLTAALPLGPFGFPVSILERPIGFEGQYYFGAWDSGGWEPWKSDGTAAGTVRIANTLPDPAPPMFPSSFGPSDFVAFDGFVYFQHRNVAGGMNLWRTDGSAAGTTLVKELSAAGGTDAAGARVVGGTLYFVTGDGASGVELWKSDGSEAGTQRVKDIAPGPASSYPGALTNVNGTLFFSADDGADGRELWTSDGSEAGTVRVKDIGPGSSLVAGDLPSAVMDGTLYFAASDGVSGTELWKSDGSAAGTVAVADLVPGPVGSNPTGIVASNGKLLFAADGVAGRELWTSDGSAAGTQLVKDVGPGTLGSDPSFKSGPFFVAAEPATGDELYLTDGTSAGTHLVKDINPGSPGSISGGLAPFGGAYFFAGDDTSPTGLGRELWKTDGTEAGTLLVKDIFPGSGHSGPRDFANLGERLLFVATDATHGSELWSTDGSEAGTQLVADIRPGATDGQIEPTLALNGVAYFVANDGTHGGELWRSDGTGPGTSMVIDLYPGSVASAPAAPLVAWNEWIWFRARTPAAGFEVFRSDGTQSGTQLLADIVPGSAGSNPGDFAAMGSALYFTAVTPATGKELWRTDGTAAGTALVKDIRPGTSGSLVEIQNPLLVAGGVLYMIADAGAGKQLWRSDGTDAGTFALPFVPLAPGATPQVIDDRLVFMGSDAQGEEPWVSDGTPVGTRRLADVLPGPGSSRPSGFKRIGDSLVFSALSADAGREPFALPASLLTDADSDGLDDAVETSLGTDPFDADSDDDGLLDGEEVDVHGTDPLDVDSDDDGFSDPVELMRGSDPLDPQSTPAIAVPLLSPFGVSLLAASLLAAGLRHRRRA